MHLQPSPSRFLPMLIIARAGKRGRNYVHIGAAAFSTNKERKRRILGLATASIEGRLLKGVMDTFNGCSTFKQKREGRVYSLLVPSNKCSPVTPHGSGNSDIPPRYRSPKEHIIFPRVCLLISVSSPPPEDVILLKKKGPSCVLGGGSNSPKNRSARGNWGIGKSTSFCKTDSTNFSRFLLPLPLSSPVD